MREGRFACPHVTQTPAYVPRQCTSARCCARTYPCTTQRTRTYCPPTPSCPDKLPARPPATLPASPAPHVLKAPHPVRGPGSAEQGRDDDEAGADHVEHGERPPRQAGLAVRGLGYIYIYIYIGVVEGIPAAAPEGRQRGSSRVLHAALSKGPEASPGATKQFRQICDGVFERFRRVL